MSLQTLTLLALASALAAGGCEDTETVPDSPVTTPPPDTAIAASDPAIRTEPLDSVRILKTWLVNSRSTSLLVDAGAGAAPVAVDSLGPMDSARVNLEVRADSVRLTTRSPDGRVFGARWLHVSEDSVTRLELP